MNQYEAKYVVFAVAVVELKKALNKQREYNMADQVSRAGTAIGALQREATYAESDQDMIHKLRIALKEAGETQYWLEIIYRTNYITQTEYFELKNKCEELAKMLVSSINTINQRLSQK